MTQHIQHWTGNYTYNTHSLDFSTNLFSENNSTILGPRLIQENGKIVSIPKILGEVIGEQAIRPLIDTSSTLLSFYTPSLGGEDNSVKKSY